MKTQLTLLVFCFLTIALPAQQTQYNLDPFQTQKILLELDSIPNVYEVSEKIVRHNVIHKKEQKTEAYAQLEREILKLQKDSIANTRAYQERIDAYEAIHLIPAEIEKFLSSSLSYKFKKEHLIRAQKRATVLRKKFLIYADQNINPTQQAKFTVLKNKDLDLKVHLKRIIWEIERNYTKPAPLRLESIHQLNKKHAILRGTKKYETVIESTKKYDSKRVMIGQPVTDLTLLSGVFQKVDDYCLIAYDYETVLKNQLIPAYKIKLLKIPSSHYTKLTSKWLIQHLESKAYYFVDQSFLNDFHHNPNTTPVAQHSKLTASKIGYKHSSKKMEIIDDHATTTYFLNQYNTAIEESKEYTERLKAHEIALFKGKMTRDRSKKWKKDIDLAELLHQKIELMQTYKTSLKTMETNNFKNLYKALSSAKATSGF